MDSTARSVPTHTARAEPPAHAPAGATGSATFDPTSPQPGEPPPAERIAVTREALRDGSLLAAARLRVPPGTTLLSDAAIEADLDAKLAQRPPGADVWLFGYGSLMWNPAIEFAERRPGAVHGWHRRFCLWLHMGRGAPDNPGLMLALERGGRCAGLLFRIPAAEARAELLLAWRREMFTGAYRSRWVTATTDAGPVRAATFVANRTHPRYAGRLDEAAVAARLATASGSLGSCATYLAETVGALQAAGLRDDALERLQRLVGEGLEVRT
ncbi:MAG TPA: gamma-glutamylcyclotransferase [Acetobacteraceae bacterium]|nr:gamma-glutamylcyclotransferase [Acetobacteraceae bacterium]